MEAVTQINRKSLRAQKTGHHKKSRMDVRKSQESCTVPVSVPPVNKDERERSQRRENVKQWSSRSAKLHNTKEQRLAALSQETHTPLSAHREGDTKSHGQTHATGSTKTHQTSAGTGTIFQRLRKRSPARNEARLHESKTPHWASTA